MQNYKDAYAKFEAVLYGATEKGGITVEGAEIDAEMKNVIQLAIDNKIDSEDPLLGIIPLVLGVFDEFPEQEIPFHVIQEVISKYRAAHPDAPTATPSSDPATQTPSISIAPSSCEPSQRPPFIPLSPETRLQTIYSASTGKVVGKSKSLDGEGAIDLDAPEQTKASGSEAELIQSGHVALAETGAKPEEAAEMIVEDVTAPTLAVAASEEQIGVGDVEFVEEKASDPERGDEEMGSGEPESGLDKGDVEEQGDRMEIDGGNDERVILRIKKRKRDDDDYQDDGMSVDGDGYEAYLAQLRRTVPEKRQRPTEPPSSTMIREGDDRASFPSPFACTDCTLADEDCFTFVGPTRKGEKKRKACTRCYKYKKKCSFNLGLARRRKSRMSAVKTESDEEISIGEDEQPSKGKKPETRKQDKGKRRASVVKKEGDGLELEWENTTGMMAGPSSGRRRRAPVRATDIAELYARLTAMETESRRFQEETVERLTEVEQDVDRAASDGKVQGEFLAQQLAKVEVQAQSAYQQSAATQVQVEGLRQQTHAITETMRSFNENATRTSEFLGGLMTRLERMRFDIGNSIDTWGSIRFGAIPGAPTTVQGDQLHQPDLPWPTVEPGKFPIPAAPMEIAATPPPPHNISSTESSPSKAVWGEFMLSQSSDLGVAKAVETRIENMDLPEPTHPVDVDTAGLGHRPAQEISAVESHITDEMYAHVEQQEEKHGEGAAQETQGPLVGIRRALTDIEEVPEEPLPHSPTSPVASHPPATAATPTSEPGIPPEVSSVAPIDAPPRSSFITAQDQLSSTVPVRQADQLHSRLSPLNPPPIAVPPKTRSRSLSRAPSPGGQGPMTRSRSSSILKGSRPPRSKSSSLQR